MPTAMAPWAVPVVDVSNVTGVLSVAHGGTGATTAAEARANLGISGSGPETAVAGETLVVGNIIALATGGGNAGRAYKASRATPNLPAIGIVTSGGVLGDTIEYVTAGSPGVTMDAAPATTENGATVYLSTTAGVGTLTLPTAGSTQNIGQLTGGNDVTTTPSVLLHLNLNAVL